MKKKVTAKTAEKHAKRGPGRPRLGQNLRAVELRVRLTAAQATDLARRAAGAGQTVSDFVRRACGVPREAQKDNGKK